MNYGEIISGTFRIIWREKKLWLFGLIGLALSALASGVYMASAMNWQSSFIANMSRPEFYNSADPESMFAAMFTSMGWLFGGMGFMLCVGLIGYVINLIMRGATIAEADRAWAGEKVEVERGARVGANRGLYLFVVDLLWFLLPSLILFAAWACGLLLMFGGIAAGANANADSAAAAFASLGSMFAFFGIVGCFALIIAVVKGIFSPLMYQEAVLGEQSLGAAIKKGYSLARENLGPMVIFMLVMFVIYVISQTILQIASLPLMGVWMSNFFGMMGDFSDEMVNIPPPSAGNQALLFLGGLFYGAVMLLLHSFSQTFALTMYARVYRQLTTGENPGRDEHSLPEISETGATSVAH